MTWAESTRRADLPADWKALRLRVLERDGWVCRIVGPACTINATEVDHVGDRRDHSMTNLRATCRACHGRRTQQQALDSRLRRSRIAVEPPPGLIPTEG